MANILPREKRVAVISCLVEGMGIRSVERLTGVHRDTVMRLGVRVGQGCRACMDATLRNLACNSIEIDEIWGFIGKKQRLVRHDDSPDKGDVWTYVAIDPQTKLVPAFLVGKRALATTDEFVTDLASRMRNRIRLSSDGMQDYPSAVERAWGRSSRPTATRRNPKVTGATVRRR